ncbi:MAG: OmpH family outer membrane protein [Bacteroidales bacterium]|nr:OmpH family outer membrane protein [Bacteroidales bacterium]MBD5222133.1 OmpH family outer membrane protein [Bacteroidales bacterium]
MLKKILVAVALALPMFASAQTLKVGLVDINEVLAAMPETKAAQTKLEEAQKRYEAEYQKLGEEFQKKYEEVANMKADELPAIKERKTRELQEFQQKISQFEQQVQTSMAQMQEAELAPIYQKINTAIEAVGKEGNFSLMQMNNPQIVLFYQDPVVNATPLVKQKLGL